MAKLTQSRTKLAHCAWSPTILGDYILQLKQQNWTLVLTISTYILLPLSKQIRMPVHRISHHSLDDSTTANYSQDGWMVLSEWGMGDNDQVRFYLHLDKHLADIGTKAFQNRPESHSWALGLKGCLMVKKTRLVTNCTLCHNYQIGRAHV